MINPALPQGGAVLIYIYNRSDFDGTFSGLFKSRDKPKNSYDSPSYTYFFGRTHAGKRVNDRTALRQIAVYACVRVLSEAIAQLPLHLYKYTDEGKERVPEHPLYFLLHDQPNPEMTSFIFRETLMSHLLIYGNAFAQIIRNGRGEVLGLYPLMPDKVRVDRDEQNRLIYKYSRYDEANPNLKEQGEIILPAEQVLHIRGLGLTDLWAIRLSLWQKTLSAWRLPVMNTERHFLRMVHRLLRCWNIRALSKIRACP